MGSESIAQEAKGQMGYGLLIEAMSTRGIIFYCLSKIQVVDQKYRNKTEAKLKLANAVCFGFESQCFLPLVVSMFSSDPPQTPFLLTKSTLKNSVLEKLITLHCSNQNYN